MGWPREASRPREWDAYDLLRTVPEGLNPDEAQRRLELHGNNDVRRHEPYPLWRIALAFEPGEDFVVKRPPMGGQARIFDRIAVTYMVVAGIISGVGTLLVFHYVLNVDPDAGGSLALAQTAAVTMMVMFQLFHVVSCRSLVTSIFRIAPFSNPFLAISVAVSLVARFGFVYWPPMQRLFGTVPLPAEYWIYIISMSLFAVLVMEIAKIVVRRRKWHLRGGSAGRQR